MLSLYLSLTFHILIIWLDGGLFGFLLFGTPQASWICTCFLPQIREVVSHYFLKHISCPIFSPCLWLPIVQTLACFTDPLYSFSSSLLLNPSSILFYASALCLLFGTSSVISSLMFSLCSSILFWIWWAYLWAWLWTPYQVNNICFIKDFFPWGLSCSSIWNMSLILLESLCRVLRVRWKSHLSQPGSSSLV